MDKKRHIPPSRKKYEEENPSLTIRMTSAIRKTLEKIAKETGLSYAAIIKNSLEKGTKSYDTGYNDAKKEFQVTYPCSICHQDITMLPESGTHEASMEYLFNEGWGHSYCHDKKTKGG